MIHNNEGAISRRDVPGRILATTAAAAMFTETVLSQTVLQGAAKDADKPAGYIDAHVHVWTPDIKSYPLHRRFKKSNMKPSSFTPEQLFSLAKPVGVSRIVLIQMSFYRFDNSYMLDAMRKHQGVFSGVAVIDENDQPAKVMRQLKKKGVRGFRITSGGQNPGQGMQAMWRCGADEGLAMCHLINPVDLPSVDRMCGKFPRTPVVIDHFARIGIDGNIRERDLARLCKLARFKHVSVKISAFYALGKKKPPYKDLLPMIRRLRDAFGSERLMWATDCPFQVDPGHTYRESIELITRHADFLSDNDRQWLLHKTAERIFFG